ncbi:MAG: type I-E CRISPR-associated protein Cas7/Cse4/CasC [Proteobacteria bacterium]|nr:type I-E CRISPR-associated protein Cas7/Cse4/CasC [Pseudomonadota bacterium]
MTQFIQIHLLTAYPPGNLNRDDTGRPKTAVMGGAERLRISSQALKRAWRTSAAFENVLTGHIAQRTQRIGREIKSHLTDKGMEEKEALETSRKIADVFGKLKKETDDNPADIEQLAFISPEERKKAFGYADKALAGEEIDPKSGDILSAVDTAADIAMFGRMLADDPEFNREAAVQVSHALTTHRVVVEDDFYTAVDDLKRPAEDAGAGFIGVQEFGSGVFYLYICINRELLVKNLGGDEGIARLALEALIRAAATIAPSGKQNSFATHARALYILAEKGSQQPRSLAPAFLDPIGKQGDQMVLSKDRLGAFRKKLDDAYDQCWELEAEMDCSGAEAKGTLSGIVDFVKG